ncbi:MAG: P-loop NTPase [Steroidobacteraceae bacterium]
MHLPDRAINDTEIKRSVAPGPVQVIAVTGGKGGVGKSTVAINLATAMSSAGKRVLLLDGDLGLANVDVLLGLSPRNTLAHVLDGTCSLDEIIIEAPQGFHVVPGASGVANMANMSAAEHLSIVQAFSSLSSRIDTLIVDTAAGIAHGVLQFAQAAQHVLLVVCDEPASITDAYALIKVLSRNHGVREFRVLSNMCGRPGDGSQLFKKLERVASRFLDVVLEYVGEVPEDPYLKRAIREQRPVTEAYPASPAAQAFKKLAIKAVKWPVPPGPRGNLEFFVERLVRRNAVRLEVVQ